MFLCTFSLSCYAKKPTIYIKSPKTETAGKTEGFFGSFLPHVKNMNYRKSQN